MMSDDIEKRLAALEGANANMELFMANMIRSVEEQRQRTAAYDSTYTIGERYFFQTSVYSYIGVVRVEEPGRLLLEDAAIVKLRESLFDVIDKIDETMLLPIKDLCLAKGYICSTFKWEEVRRLAKVTPL